VVNVGRLPVMHDVVGAMVEPLGQPWQKMPHAVSHAA
jgi:hypothetical protein